MVGWFKSNEFMCSVISIQPANTLNQVLKKKRASQFNLLNKIVRFFSFSAKAKINFSPAIAYPQYATAALPGFQTYRSTLMQT